MNKKQWVAACFLTSLLQVLNANAEYQATYPQLEPVNSTHITTLPWWNERDTLPSLPPTLLPHNASAQQPSQGFIAPRQYNPTLPRTIKLQPASYKRSPVRTLRNALNCQQFNVFNLPDHCIKRSGHNRLGLQAQRRYLLRQKPAQRVAGRWANVPNAALLETVNRLLHWEQGYGSGDFREQFHLREINSSQHTGKADYTGYFTPVLQVQSYPDHNYRYPIYKRPINGTRLSRAEIDRGALRGQNLEIAWTNDKINLFFVQMQGSAIVRYPDGRQRFLGYAANNNHRFRKINQFLRQHGYNSSSFSNANVAHWLRSNPHKIDTILHHNPRYIFFHLSDRSPTTTSGSTVLPGHTLAVDNNYIPFGAVLLAEIPRLNHNGQEIGRDWRLLFAQDNGSAIKGPGRLDLYTGMGQEAEKQTYRITGFHRTYLLLPKSGSRYRNTAEM